MKKSLFVIAAFIVALIGPSALAADMPVKAPPIVASLAYDWSGFYGGGNAGWVRSSYDWRYTNPAPATCCAPFSASVEDYIFGGHAGAQLQFSHFVVGVEGSLSDTGYGSKFAARGAPACVFPNNSTTICQIQTQTLYTAGGRLGFAWDAWLIYGDGGWAQANVRSQLNSNPVNGLAPFDTTNVRHSGSYFGGGVEYMLVHGPKYAFIIGAEYQHVDLRSQLHNAPLDAFGACPPGVNCRTIAAKEDIVRARASVLFNPFGWTAVRL